MRSFNIGWILVTAICVAGLAACVSEYSETAGTGPFTPPPAKQADMVAKRFAQLQRATFASGVEHCGYLARRPDGGLAFTEMVAGDQNGCTPDVAFGNLIPIASMHTHGTYSPDVPAEFPTVRDMRSDQAEGVNGYVATPGGRLWYIDSKAMITQQLCGIGCLPKDPKFRAGDDGIIAQSYSARALKEIEGSVGLFF